MFGRRGCLLVLAEEEVAEWAVEAVADESTLELDRERLFKPAEEVDSNAKRGREGKKLMEQFNCFTGVITRLFSFQLI